MKQAVLIRLSPVAAIAALTLAGCSGGGSNPNAGTGTGGDFLVLKTEPQNNGQLFLNEPIRIDFSNPVDITSADLNTLSFQVLDQNGQPLTEQPAGTFELDRSPGDDLVGRRLMFVPRFPTNDTFDNGGFRPGRTYLVQLVGGDRRNGTVLRDTGGRGLEAPVTFRFSTADGTTPAQLFRDRVPGGPRRVAFAISPTPESQGVTLSKFGDGGIEVRLTFDQPLNPHSDNVPVKLDTDPLLRSLNDRGRIFLEYNDPDSGTTWIPADVELEVNDLNSAVVVLRPVGVLPNNADIRCVVENTLEDIAGESNVANAAYDRVFGEFKTRQAYEPQFDAIVESFDSGDLIDVDAPFLEPRADLGNGYAQANFDFQGTSTTLEYEPTEREVFLNTDFTQIRPRNGQPFNVSGGVFNFKNVTIPQGVTVIGQGTKPMVWLVAQDFRVAGELSVRGGNGDRVNVLNSANFPASGGVGVCGGGNGGRGSPNSTARSFNGEAGFGPGQVPGGGGRGGNIDCTLCGTGSAGGGGSFATQGDPWFKVKAGTGTAFQQQIGIGGQGCSGASGSASRSLPGGDAGPLAFIDARTDNDFWGSAVNREQQIRILGELVAPQGGSGGGGGGDRAPNCNPNDLNFINDDKGGGGGAGGGVLIVQALGSIIVEASGRINADGGHGGGGEQAGSNDQAGGGGGGSGGMVILMAGRSIDLHVKGNTAANRFTYANNDYDFCLSADGAVSTTGTFSTPVISGKYPNSGQSVLAATQWDSRATGGFGGMGVVQLMAPSGNNSADNTNTYLDDNINIFRTGQLLVGTEKQRMIAWRGFPDDTGLLVDDFSNPTNIGDDEGDIRPTPWLMPAPFGPRSRVRSRWLDTGASVRRPLTSPDGNPRGVVEDPANALLAGPTYRFAGTQDTPTNSLTHGYIALERQLRSVSIVYPEILTSPATILSLDAGAMYQGRPVYRIELTEPALGPLVDRYVQYQAALSNAAGPIPGAEFRILSHTDRILLVSPESGPLPSEPTRLQVVAKFFDVRTSGAPGLGPIYSGSDDLAVPVANLRIGFAFHLDPANPDPYTDPIEGPSDRNRRPEPVNKYLHDLGNPATIEGIRTFGARYVQWDVLFDTTSRINPSDEPPALSPSTPRPELHFLRLPFWF